MILHDLTTFLTGKNEKQTKLSFSTVRNSPFRLANKRHLRNRGLLKNPF